MQGFASATVGVSVAAKQFEDQSPSAFDYLQAAQEDMQNN